VGRDFTRPRTPRRVADLVRHLSETADREQARRVRFANGLATLLESPVEGEEGLLPLLRALAAATPEVDSVGVLVPDGADTFDVTSSYGLAVGSGPEGRLTISRRGPIGQAIATRQEAIASAPAASSMPWPDGTRAAAAVPVLSRGEVLGVLVAGSRSTDALSPEALLLLRVGAERAGRALERRALVTSLTEAEGAARLTASYRDQVLGTVGHDLRNPLGAIVMSAALLAKRGGLQGWQGKTVNRVRSSAARMHRLIDDLLSYTRTRLGTGIPIARERTHLGALARKVVDELVAFHPDCGVHVDAAGDLEGEWDPARVEQVLSNLVANAIDHGEPDCHVEVRLRGDDARVRVEVVNRGEVPPEVRDHAFEPFRRGPEGTARRATGVGLGLYITKEIVRGHGGTVGLRSEGGETRVFVELPRRESAPAEAGARGPSPP
jgi:signal transduction histidine kinase